MVALDSLLLVPSFEYLCRAWYCITHGYGVISGPTLMYYVMTLLGLAVGGLPIYMHNQPAPDYGLWVVLGCLLFLFFFFNIGEVIAEGQIRDADTGPEVSFTSYVAAKEEMLRSYLREKSWSLSVDGYARARIALVFFALLVEGYGAIASGVAR